MGKIGKSYPRDALSALNDQEALRRFDRPLVEPDDSALRYELAAAIVGVLGVLGLVGWALSL